MNKKFLIPSLLAAGFGATSTEAAPPSKFVIADNTKTSLFALFRQQHTYTLAAHRSHSSHGSHSSHRSSSGGGYSAPRAAPSPLYTAPSNRNSTSTPPSSVLPSPPAAAARTLPGNSGAFQRIAMQVQTALLSYGYYSGAIDGVIGAGSKSALSRFQADYGLSVTGTITPEVLDAFGIVAN
ncbi:His-Xaa-Ser repeat protein HxsA [Puniceibacterium antarcticum]|uniref:His-Xaa-Ser repeat protein HxsA n=1 Tax=Puniceibacterium antarcticum TaxID=1206336 RepID=UPI000C193071